MNEKPVFALQEHFLRIRIKSLDSMRDVLVDMQSDDLEIKTVIDDLENAIFRLRKAADTLGDMQDE
jgi:hypothetical protein